MISVKELIKHYENMNKCPSRTYETEESDVIMKEIESDQNENSLGKVNDLINYWETIENGEESDNTLGNSVEQRDYTFKYCPLSFDTKVTFVK
ncbi:hypothetical protein TUBRATIS_18650 [Tubulinosema ratisbonensis]|uniref:Uncharacterized protein n=1 Tax=Tubulinosema ratisbonensis TaxID=291195 RepID=A0A437AKR5_9MICR|nr:hypothetical protein TUBRATIS_18650 [Tubulinosema ratisbonensis]